MQRQEGHEKSHGCPVKIQVPALAVDPVSTHLSLPSCTEEQREGQGSPPCSGPEPEGQPAPQVTPMPLCVAGHHPHGEGEAVDPMYGVLCAGPGRAVQRLTAAPAA